MKRVLVAPLDWGLGHATRCIPVIRALLERHCEVYIASAGNAIALLRHEFPTLHFFELPAYNPRYPRTGAMAFKMIVQIPKFWDTIRREHQVLESIVRQHQIALVISDNRYGCWSDAVPSIFITHQSNILMPKRFGVFAGLVRRANEKMTRKFSVCWIPDLPGEHSLAGALAALAKNRKVLRHRYVGLLSRFKRGSGTTTRYDLLCIFSGPEPQRTLLENIVVRQMQQTKLRVVIVRGLPAGQNHPPLETVAEVVEFATTDQLQLLIDASSVVLARSGFSTVMDLAQLGKKAIFIPTPGQTEQEYLAERLSRLTLALCVKQENFDLKKAWESSKTCPGFGDWHQQEDMLTEAIDEALRL
ncbi:MAG TPA: glycosyltransferase [Ohtaekwangia sp.]|nr:glycosyltransferase [Ohtaekwangia sp.]